MIKEAEIQKLADRIVKLYHPEKIFLFGSFAWGKPTENSDIDLLVVKETENPRSLAMKIDNSIFPRDFPMDVIVYTPGQLKKGVDLEDPFALKISQKGKILFSTQE